MLNSVTLGQMLLPLFSYIGDDPNVGFIGSCVRVLRGLVNSKNLTTFQMFGGMLNLLDKQFRCMYTSRKF